MDVEATDGEVAGATWPGFGESLQKRNVGILLSHAVRNAREQRRVERDVTAVRPARIGYSTDLGKQIGHVATAGGSKRSAGGVHASIAPTAIGLAKRILRVCLA